MTLSTLGRKTLTLSMAFLFGLVLAMSNGQLLAQEPTKKLIPKGPILRGIDRCFKKMTKESKQTSPWGMSYGVASPAQGPAPTQSPCTPWYGYGLGVPTYSYGWFGATYRPARVSHTGYYGNFYQWGYRRGF